MPRGLVIETSGRLGSIAITEAGRVIAEDSFAHGLKHAAEMVPRIDALLKAAGWLPADVREIYVSAGPGSFTGLRIGITLAKTLAFATGAKIVAVPSAEVLARNAPSEAQNVLIVLDAKRDQIFTARLHRDDPRATWKIVEPAHLDTLPAMLSRAPRPVHLIGEGISFHEKFLDRADSSVIVTSEDLWRPRPQAVAAIGFDLAREQLFTPLDSLTPIYIRKPEAEEKYEAAAGRVEN
ncbi:MAG TPA: tRNA (adenosine(37)-N6)-threonylcarbamoyltransferase complex dimerization subunit type 1 TsaB [Tepidisphaeraceae bacterium]|jgi:tRNA threonylcarbamoyladenosine biosynthesis protein TsaB|nr:tRNA (adenosine(37)-N6)-threonylcarbamoyltransferase complex dimerization subunit type 1 TsaB [Tepidisphaeraceae bacterium]